MSKILNVSVGIVIGYFISVLPIISYLSDRNKTYTDPAEVFAISEEYIEIIQHLEVDGLDCVKERWCRWLAEAVVYEARGEEEVGQRAVAYVILNRVNAKGWPSTVKDVILQNKQFSYVEDMHQQAKPTMEDWRKAYRVAWNSYKGYSKNPIGNSLWYHSASMKKYPKWASSYKVYSVIGNHIFYFKEIK